MERITSRDNPLIKEYGRLAADRAARRETGRFVLEGARLCKDAALSGVKIENAFFTPAAAEKSGELCRLLSGAGARVFEISEAAAQKIAETKSAQGVFCTALMLDKAFELNRINIDGAYLALENLQDPGNMGAVLRTAEALGFDGVLLSSGCVDVYSPKVVRSAMGAVFRLPVLEAGDLPPALRRCGEMGMKTLAAVPAREAVPLTGTDLGGGVVVAVGNEGSGLTAECIEACGQRVVIPMAGRAESLNAAAAAAILMWEVAKRRPA